MCRDRPSPSETDLDTKLFPILLFFRFACSMLGKNKKHSPPLVVWWWFWTMIQNKTSPTKQIQEYCQKHNSIGFCPPLGISTLAESNPPWASGSKRRFVSVGQVVIDFDIVLSLEIGRMDTKKKAILEEASPLKHMLCTLNFYVYLSNLPGHVWNVSLHGLFITAFFWTWVNGGQHSMQHLKHLPC